MSRQKKKISKHFAAVRVTDHYQERKLLGAFIRNLRFMQGYISPHANLVDRTL